MKYKIGSLIKLPDNKLMRVSSITKGKGRVRYSGIDTQGNARSAWEVLRQTTTEKLNEAETRKPN